MRFTGMTPVGRNSRNYFFGGVNASAAPDSAWSDTAGRLPGPSATVTGTKIAPDGWTFDNNTWQGVRTYDASVGQWNTPDAYAGDVRDPMSQKPFMWNRNNPYDYADPSGFNPFGDWLEKAQDFLKDHLQRREILGVSPGLEKDMGARVDRTYRSIKNDLKPDTVRRAISEAQGGLKVARAVLADADHATSVQRGVNSINTTLEHIGAMESKYANSAQDTQALQLLKQSFQATKDALRQEFQKAGVEGAIKW